MPARLVQLARIVHAEQPDRAGIAQRRTDRAFVALEYHDAAAAQGQRTGQSKADDAGTDHDRGCMGHTPESFRARERSQSTQAM
jgi:hypothetical protein